MRFIIATEIERAASRRAAVGGEVLVEAKRLLQEQDRLVGCQSHGG